MEKKGCSTLCKGLWIGGAVALTIILSRKEWRDKLKEEAIQLKDCTTDAVVFFKGQSRTNI